MTTEQSTPTPPGAVPSSAAVSARMSRQRRRDTGPELLLRKELHRHGLRFRVDHPLPGLPRRRADVVFTRARIAVFVDGCFWHSCPEHATSPASNAEWWRVKLDKNVTRGRETDRYLADAGWTVLRFWEHEDMTQAASVVKETWQAARATGQARQTPQSDSKSQRPHRCPADS